MNKDEFRDMSDEDLKAYHPPAYERDAYEHEIEYRDDCREKGKDPYNKDVRNLYDEDYEEDQKSANEGAESHIWENMSPEDRAGWEDNMNKD